MKINISPEKIKKVLERGSTEIIDKEHFKKQLESGKKLRVKFGVDPTSSYLHLGHAVPLRKLKQFQDLGHTVILLIGDYTAIVGDPTGRDITRPVLSENDIKKNMKTYIKQAGKILNIKKTEVRYNSEWFAKSNFMQLIMDLTSKITVARILERDDFQKRLKEGSDIQMQEIMYPLLQGYDSVALKADVEIGGTDQKFNLLMGRKIQKKYNQPEQDILTVPLLVGVDGEKKMSKSYDNYIALEDVPENMYGKVMSIPDNLMKDYFELCTDVSMGEVKNILAGDPRDAKMKLAFEIVSIYHSGKEAKKAEEHFVKVIQKKEKPEDISELKPKSYNIIEVLVEANIVSSKSDARRAIEQGGVKVNNEKISDFKLEVKSNDIIQKGKRYFIKIK